MNSSVAGCGEDYGREDAADAAERGKGDRKREREEEPTMIFPPEGVKVSITFPSGLIFSVWGLYVHFFGEMDIPYHFAFSEAEKLAYRVACDCGYGIRALEATRQLEIENDYEGDHFLITFGDKGMCNVEDLNKKAKQ